MNKIDLRRPSPICRTPNGPWSLWDMLSLYGWRVLALCQQIVVTKEGIARTMDHGDDPRAPTIEINPDNGINAEGLLINIARSLADEIGMESTKLQLNTLMVMSMTRAPLSEFLAGLDQLAVRVQEDLRTKPFMFVPAAHAEYWGKNNLFGENVAKKFKGCDAEIRSAGNCLALNEPTACVFHLMRAMEIAVHYLGKRLRMTIPPDATWRQMTGNMDTKIKTLPKATARQMSKKNDWEEARANLHHVGSVWRNKTMHPAKSYTPSQAMDIFNAVRVFMNGLCAL